MAATTSPHALQFSGPSTKPLVERACRGRGEGTAHLDEALQDRPADGLFVCVGELSLPDQHPIPVEEVMVGPPGGRTGA